MRAYWSNRDRETPPNRDGWGVGTVVRWSSLSIPFHSGAAVCRIPERRSIKRAERENSLGQLFLYMGSRFKVDMSGQGKAHIPPSSSRTRAAVCSAQPHTYASMRTTLAGRLTNQRRHRGPRGRPPVSRWNVPTSPRHYLMHRARCQWPPV